MDFTTDDFLGGKIKLKQPKVGCRATSDAVFLGCCAATAAKGQVLDIGCGSGILSLIIAKSVENCTVTGIDIQKDLLDLARENAEMNDVAKTTDFQAVDITKPIPQELKNKQFDYVVTNPPFYEEGFSGACRKDREVAFHSDKELFQTWLTFAVKRVRPKGSLIMIYKADKLADILGILNGRLGNIKVFPLYSGKDKQAGRVIISGVKNSSARLQLFQGLIVHNSDGSFTDTAGQILQGKMPFTF